MKDTYETRKSDLKIFISKEDESIISQLEAFVPGKTKDFTAIRYLRNSGDIKRFWDERIAEIKLNNPDDLIPEETLRAELAKIAMYGDDYEQGFQKFKEVLGSEFEKGIKAAMEFNKTNTG